MCVAASGLKVNFSKSCLIGINVPRDFMEMTCNFLNCTKGNLPFNYLGLPIGANPRRVSTWEPLWEHVVKRLNLWGNKFNSFGGCIVLLNSMLNSIPIFYLSFMRMSVIVWKRLIRIQREFLWGGVLGGKKISWVKWRTVCQPKEEGGLGVRDIRVVNLSLLAKWRWRMIQGENSLWMDVLLEKYAPNIRGLWDSRSAVWPHYASRWWKDVATLDDGGGANWFNAEVERRVLDGVDTSFWNVVWRGNLAFRHNYPRLFAMSNQKEAMVAEILVGNEVGREWNFLWCRQFFVWEEGILANLMDDLNGYVVSKGWISGGGGWMLTGVSQ